MCNLFSSSTSRRTISMSTAITWFILKFFFTISTNGFYISNYITNFALYSFTIFIFISNIFRSRCKTKFNIRNYFNFRVLGKFSKILELPKDYAILESNVPGLFCIMAIVLVLLLLGRISIS